MLVKRVNGDTLSRRPGGFRQSITKRVMRLVSDPDPIDVFALADALAERGWFHDRQTPPDNLHSTVSNSNTGVIDDYIRALHECVVQVGDAQAADRSTNYATLE